MTHEERSVLEAIPLQKRTIAQLRNSLEHQLSMVDYAEAIKANFQAKVNALKTEMSKRRVPIYGEGKVAAKVKKPKLKIVKAQKRCS